MKTEPGSAPAPAPQPPAPTDPLPAPNPAPPPPAPGSADWHAKFTGDDLGWLQNRGLTAKGSDDAFAAIVAAARNAEKKIGVPADRLVTLPADMSAPGALDEVYAKLGRPAKVEEYGIKAEDGDAIGADFVNKFTAAAFANGLTKTQAEAFFKEIDSTISGLYESEQKAAEAKSAADMLALKNEWGQSYDFNLLVAKEAARTLGLSKDELAAMETAMGSSAALIRAMNKLGAKRQESPFISGFSTPNAAGVNTPEGASVRLKELMDDAGWRKKFHENDAATLREYRALNALRASAQ